MPRPKKVGGPEPKKRSRNGCWPCKGRKVKCDEQHPVCMNCQRQGETCDYSIRLNWDGRGKKKEDDTDAGQTQIDFSAPIASTVRTIEPIQAVPVHIQPRIHPTSRYGYNQTSVTEEGNPHAIDPDLAGFPDKVPEAYLGIEQHSQQSLDGSGDVTEGKSVMRSQALRRVGYDTQYSGSISSGTQETLSPRTTVFGITTIVNEEHSVYPSRHDDDTQYNEPRPRKRARYGPSPGGEPFRSYEMPPPIGLSAPYASPEYVSWQPSLSVTTDLLTHSDEYSGASFVKPSIYVGYDAAESARRKPSIESLLSGPAGMGPEHDPTGRCSFNTTRGSFSDHRGSVSTYGEARLSISEPYPEKFSKLEAQEPVIVYGLDRGFRDLDIPSNDDMYALSGKSPGLARAHLHKSLEHEDTNPEFGFGVQARRSIDLGDEYYQSPVEVKLPRSWEPLPASLHNPMNMLYFHHFLSHTARLLIPHHCSANPFQRLLPKMALQDQNLMSLLLAYSAAHRAKLLRQPVPATRLSQWVQDIVPNLFSALNDPYRMADNSTFATAIMLASLEIICPGAFGADIGWQKHLAIARQMIAVRGGSKSMQQEHSEITQFLLRWFAYLEIVGNLTGGQSWVDVETSWGLDYSSHNEEHDSFEIDCLLGFTHQCIGVLAKISNLAQACDKERVLPNGTIRDDYECRAEIKEQAIKLIADTHHSLTHTEIRRCQHVPAPGDVAFGWNNIEVAAVNTAFHWAGLVHLQRRVLGKPSDSEDVQEAVQQILVALKQVKEGSTAEACLLFPMFTAGCDALTPEQRADITKRIQIVEDCGLSQVRKARSLMERVWETGKPWETLAAGEFVG